MTLASFVRKNTFRNLRRSILTVLSIGGSLLLLTFLITIWRSFYDSKPSAAVGATSDRSPQSVADLQFAQLLPAEDPGHSSRKGSGESAMVWRAVHR